MADEQDCVREQEIETIKRNGEMDDIEMDQMLRAQRMKSIDGVHEDVEALINTHFFDEFWKTKSSEFLKRVIENQKMIEMGLFKKTWKSLNCSTKDHEGDSGDPREPPVCWEEKRTHHKKEGGDSVLVQQDGGTVERKAHHQLLP